MKMKAVFLFSLFTIMLIGLSITASSNSKTTVVQPPSPREGATVSISFDGLMAVCFGNPERVSAGILNAPHHTPEVTVTKIRGEQRSIVALLRGEQLRRTLYFDVEGISSSGVSRYYAESMDDPNDFRWNIDMEGDLFQRQLYINEEKLFGKIHFSSGLFYADKLSEQPVKFFAADNSGKALPFNRRIAELAAKINLAMGDALVIRGGSDTLRLVAEPGVRYEITIHNLPPADMANMNHWLYYYDVIGEKVTPYEPVMARKATFSPFPLICANAVFSKSRLN